MFVLDVIYNRVLGIDEKLENQLKELIGFGPESSGQGIGGRDLQWHFDSFNSRNIAANKISNLPVSVIKR